MDVEDPDIVLSASSGRHHRVCQTTASQRLWGCSNLSFDDSSRRTETLAMDRVAMLTEILSENPSDAFARYGLAMEYSNQGDVDRAMEEFRKLLETHPDYTAG